MKRKRENYIIPYKKIKRMIGFKYKLIEKKEKTVKSFEKEENEIVFKN